MMDPRDRKRAPSPGAPPPPAALPDRLAVDAGDDRTRAGGRGRRPRRWHLRPGGLAVNGAEALLTADVGGVIDALIGRITEIRRWAHEPAHFRDLRLKEGEKAPPLPDEHKCSVKIPGWETSLFFSYAIDMLADLEPDGRGGTRLRSENPRYIRHLCVQLSLPARVTQGQLNLKPPTYCARRFSSVCKGPAYVCRNTS